MSYQLFKVELMTKVFKAHDSRTKFGSSFATAYNNLIQRHFDTITGGGVFITGNSRKPVLGNSINSILMTNYSKKIPVNFFDQIAPFIYAYWTGLNAIGPTGTCIVTYPGLFKGAPIPTNSDINIFINVAIGVISTHLKTMTGIYTNIYSGITTPWSGGTLITTP